MRGRGRALLAVSLLAACTTSSSNTELTRDLAIRAAEVVCETRARCCSAAELDLLDRVDDAACRISERTYFEASTMPALAAAVARGRLDFDADALVACFDDLAARDCDAYAATFRRDIWDVIEGCDGVITPHQGPGEVCRLSSECTTRFCLHEGPAYSAVGVCARLPVRDEACPDLRCAEGLYCEPALERCVPLLADGAACTSHAECGTGFCTGTCVGLCTGGGTTDQTEPHVLEGLGALMVEAECGHVDECCVAEGELAERLRVPGVADETTCRTWTAFYVANMLDERYGAIRRGLGSIDQARLDACRAWLEAPVDCADFSTSQPRYLTGPCEEWFVGTVGCDSYADCGPNAACFPGFTEDFYGECSSVLGPGAMGDACLDDDACAQGACVGNDAALETPGVCRAVCGGLR